MPPLIDLTLNIEDPLARALAGQRFTNETKLYQDNTEPQFENLVVARQHPKHGAILCDTDEKPVNREDSFVILPGKDGDESKDQIIIGTGEYSSHPILAGGKPVKYAGKIKVVNGKVDNFNFDSKMQPLLEDKLRPVLSKEYWKNMNPSSKDGFARVEAQAGFMNVFKQKKDIKNTKTQALTTPQVSMDNIDIS